MTEFVESFVAENRLVRGFKLREYQRSGLLSELVRLGIKTQEGGCHSPHEETCR